MNLQNNKIQTLEGGVFTGVPALTTLDLKNNLLETLTYNNILPLMDNLVNNTSILTITGKCILFIIYAYNIRTEIYVKIDNFRIVKTLLR